MLPFPHMLATVPKQAYGNACLREKRERERANLVLQIENQSSLSIRRCHLQLGISQDGCFISF